MPRRNSTGDELKIGYYWVRFVFEGDRNFYQWIWYFFVEAMKIYGDIFKHKIYTRWALIIPMCMNVYIWFGLKATGIIFSLMMLLVFYYSLERQADAKERELRSVDELLDSINRNKQLHELKEYNARKIAKRENTRLENNTEGEKEAPSETSEPVSANVPMLDIKHENLKAFYLKYVVKYDKLLKKAGVYEAVIQIIKILNENRGTTSISDADDNKHYPKNSNNYTILKNVSLIDHSIAVAKNIIQGKSKEGPETINGIGKWIILGLGHDLGKIGKYRQRYSSATQNLGHQATSEVIVRGILPDAWRLKKDILTAIKDHHVFSSDRLTITLKQADYEARHAELTESDGSKPDEYLEEMAVPKTNTGPRQVATTSRHANLNLAWTTKEDLLHEIASEVNIVIKDKYYAFTLNNVVYCQKIYIVKRLSGLAINSPTVHLILPAIQDPKNTDNVALAIRGFLDEHIHETIGKKYIGQWFQVTTVNNENLNPGYYTPILESAFSDEDQRRFKERLKKHNIISTFKDIKFSRRK